MAGLRLGGGEPVTKILVAEDNPADVYLLREAFLVATDDVELLIVADGEQSLEYIQRRGQFRDALIRTFSVGSESAEE